MGFPSAGLLVPHHTVVGVDISRQQLLRARVTMPAGRFVFGDMTAIAFRPHSFDAVFSFYAIFHTARSTHEALFRRVHDWLRPGGLLVASLASGDEAGYTEDFFGVEMYWSNFALQPYLEMLSSCGFKVVEQRVISHGYAGNAPAEAHPLVFAEKA